MNKLFIKNKLALNEAARANNVEAVKILVRLQYKLRDN